MPSGVQVRAPDKLEKFEINSASTGITEADGNGANWKDIWEYKVPVNTWVTIDAESVFACNLVGDDAAAMPNTTRIIVVRRDVANEDSKPLMPEIHYKAVQEEQDKKKMMYFRGLATPVTVGPEERVVVRIAGADAAGTGDTDASASRFKISCMRGRKRLS